MIKQKVGQTRPRLVHLSLEPC